MRHILAPDTRLTGLQVVETRTRPVRLAYLIPDWDIEAAIKAIQSCCLTWGGIFHFLIPCNKETGISPEWQTVLQALDPDDLVDCIGLPARFSEKLTASGRFVHRWDSPSEPMFVLGALQYSALNAFEWRADNQTRVLYTPDIASNHPLRYQLLARHGLIDETTIEAVLKQHYWATSTRYADFVRLVSAVPSIGEDIHLSTGLRAESAPRGLSNVYSMYSFPSLTRVGLSLNTPAYRYGGGTPEVPQYDEAYVSRIVVTGVPNSAEDLSLYWNLRASRDHAVDFPLWIPLEHLATLEGKNAVRTATTSQRQGLLPREADSKIHFLSTSVEHQDITSVLGTEFPEAVIHTSTFAHFTSRDNWVGLKRNVEVTFDDFGRGRVPISLPDPIQKLAPFDRVTLEARLKQFHLPQSRALRHKVLGTGMPRISKDGLEHFEYKSAISEFFTIGIPDAWTVLCSFFSDAGFTCRVGDKGRLLLGLFELIGGVDHIDILASSKVYELLMVMADAVGRRAFQQQLKAIINKIEDESERKTPEGLAEVNTLASEELARPYLPFSRIKEILGSTYAERVLRWLLERHLVFRGVEFTCPTCQLRRWYPLGGFTEEFTCAGCQRGQVVPLDFNSTQWRYRINELCAKAFDQGVITQALTIGASYNNSDSSYDPATIGFHGGLELSALTNEVAEATGIRTMEVDFVEVLGGRIILGECKSGGGAILDEEVVRYERLSQVVDASRLVFATLAESLNIATEAFARIKDAPTPQVDILVRSQLLDTWKGGADSEGPSEEHLRRVVDLHQL